MTATTPAITTRTRVVRFYLIAVAGPVLAAALIAFASASFPPLVGGLLPALAMPAPLIAAIVGSPRGLRGIGHDIRNELSTAGARLLLAPAAAVAWVVTAVALTWVLGDLLGLTAVGHLATDAAQVRANLATALGGAPIGGDVTVPSPVLLFALGIVGGVVAGVTINGLLAFGEEYGWRGYLWSVLEPHGRGATIGVIGVLWGLWHAPLIAIAGLNYPNARAAGVAIMVVFAVAASYPLDQLRRATGGAIGPAIFHGAINGTAGMLLLLTGGNALLGAPVGLLGACAFLPVGLALRLLVGPRREDHEAAAPIAC